MAYGECGLVGKGLMHVGRWVVMYGDLNRSTVSMCDNDLTP